MFLGIDPGRDKVGWAFTDATGALLLSGIVRATDAQLLFRAVADGEAASLIASSLENRLPESHSFSSPTILMGDGTGKEFLLSLAQSASLGVKLVSERETTLLARRLYWELHPPCGVWKLVPTTVRLPPRDIDDLAAWAIVLRYCEQSREMQE